LNQPTSNNPNKALFHYLKSIRIKKEPPDSFQKSAYKLLNLLFAYKRRQYKLHLRWNKVESHQLALFTLQELASKRGTDPVLNGIYETLLILADSNERAVQQLLKTAEDRIDEISTSQRAKATTERELNPVLKRAKHYHEKYTGLSPHEIIDRLKNDAGAYNINSFDEELGKFFYDEIGKKKPREKHISRTSVQNYIAKLRNKKIS
jgi:hypothetical protein